jgi:hypothetical protein
VKYSGASRIASLWYSWTSFTIEVNITDGNTHQVALYCLDWDGGGARAETIDVVDGGTGTILDSRAVSGFAGGKYVVWNVGGHVVLRVTGIGQAAVSGLFFGSGNPATASASFVTTDSVTQGSWRAVYGKDGEAIPNGAAAYPSYAEVSLSGQTAYSWSVPSSDIRALESPSGTGRAATVWFSPVSFAVDLNIMDGQTHQVAYYCLDWDSGGARAERIDLIDAGTGVVLDSRNVSFFTGGQYLVWNVSGHLTVRFTRTGGGNAVLSGLFFGGGATTSAAFVKLDAATQGSWQSVYGSQGLMIAADGINIPAFAQVAMSGQSAYTWNSFTSDVRALQKYSSAGRIAGTWYSGSSYTIDVNLMDGDSHQLALYCLDWDGGGGRAETVQVLDSATGNMLDTRSISAFSGGQYLVWNVSGHVTIRLTPTSGGNAVSSGLFFN